MDRSGRTYRVDYFKLIIELEHDRMQEVMRGLKTLLEEDGVLGAFQKSHSLTALGESNIHSGLRRYALEVWGESADRVFWFAPEELTPMLRRLDIRLETTVTESGLALFSREAERLNTNNKTITVMSSRPRSKKNGRDAGGFTVAIGSKKSDRRLAAYRRGTEVGAIELMVQDTALFALLGDAATEYHTGVEHHGKAFSSIKAYVFALLVEELEKVVTRWTGYSLEQAQETLEYAPERDGVMRQEIGLQQLRCAFDDAHPDDVETFLRSKGYRKD